MSFKNVLLFSEHVVLSNDQHGLSFYDVAQFETHSQQISAGDNTLQKQKHKNCLGLLYLPSNKKYVLTNSESVQFNFLWTSAQCKRASMLYFANVFIYLFIFYGRLILRPWLTEVRERFTRGGP